MLINVIAAIYLVVHGLIHLIGFVVKFQIAEMETRALGIVWLLLAVAFVISGAAIFASPAWWWSFTLAVTLVSLALCVLGWPDARFGVLANIIVLAFLFIGPRLGWIS
jgi:hypothetical protein